LTPCIDCPAGGHPWACRKAVSRVATYRASLISIKYILLSIVILVFFYSRANFCLINKMPKCLLNFLNKLILL
jgi:hypothetical protein